MSCSVLHHVEVCVHDDRLIKLLTRGFGFTPFAHRLTPSASKLALRSGNSVFVVVKRHTCITGDDRLKCDLRSSEVGLSGDLDHNELFETSASIEKSDVTTSSLEDGEHWTVFCCRNALMHTTDSVFNVSLVVNDVDAVTSRVRARGGQVLRAPTNLPAKDAGHVRYSIVTSCCGNIVHTLIDKTQYSGTFLPGFDIIDSHSQQLAYDIPSSFLSRFKNEEKHSGDSRPCKLPEESLNTCNPIPMPTNRIEKHAGEEYVNPSSIPISTHIDHVTYVCEVGRSKDLLSWYEDCFGMKRFMTNTNESKEDGFVLADNIGLRLKVMEYWKCAETGLASPGTDVQDTSLKLVIAEPLPEITTSHVDTFLRAHGGPGIQHIGLHTPTMVATVDFMARNGVVFRKAPPVYYEEGIKLDEIKEAGHTDEVELFKELGILLDTEADVFTEYEKARDRRSYLMQVFTGPLFDEETFFLEVIQRRGARGFGAGNIMALAKSIMLHNQSSKTP